MLVAAARVVVTVLPSDLARPRGRWARPGHQVAANAQFAALFALVDGPGATVFSSSRWPWAWTAHVVLDRCALVGLVALCAALIVPALRRWFGLAERVFLYSATAWVGVAAAVLLAR